MLYTEVCKARKEAKRAGINTLQTETTIRLNRCAFIVQDSRGAKYKHRPSAPFREKMSSGSFRISKLGGEYQLAALVETLQFMNRLDSFFTFYYAPSSHLLVLKTARLPVYRVNLKARSQA